MADCSDDCWSEVTDGSASTFWEHPARKAVVSITATILFISFHSFGKGVLSLFITVLLSFFFQENVAEDVL